MELTKNEALFLIDRFNGIIKPQEVPPKEFIVSMTFASLFDRQPNEKNYVSIYDLDANKLFHRIRKLPVPEAEILWDKIVKFWEFGAVVSSVGKLIEVGLLKE